LESRSLNYWQEYICIGLRRSMCLEKVVRFEITLFLEKTNG